MFGLPMYEDVPTVNTGKHSSMFEDWKKNVCVDLSLFQ